MEEGEALKELVTELSDHIYPCLLLGHETLSSQSEHQLATGEVVATQTARHEVANKIQVLVLLSSIET